MLVKKKKPNVMPLQTDWSFRVVSLQSFVVAEGQPYASELRQGQFGQDIPHKIVLHSAEYSTISRGVPTPRTCLYRNKSCISGRGNSQGLAVTLSLLGVAFVTKEIR